MNRLLPLFVATALSLGACAAEPAGSDAAGKTAAAPPAAVPSTEAAIRAAIETLAPGVVIDRIRASQISGFSEVAISGRVVYVSNDGKYLLQGTLIDIATRENLTDQGVAGLRQIALDKVGADRRIIFAPAEVKHRVTVFTDIDCGYCRKLHENVAEYNKLGIAIEYLFFPRAGIGSDSFNKSVSVWCAADRHQAMTDAKAGKDIPQKTCENPVTMDYDLGRQVGVDGTPAIYAADGTHIGGFVQPADMLARLEEVAKRSGSAAK